MAHEPILSAGCVRSLSPGCVDAVRRSGRLRVGQRRPAASARVHLPVRHRHRHLGQRACELGGESVGATSTAPVEALNRDRWHGHAASRAGGADRAALVRAHGGVRDDGAVGGGEQDRAALDDDGSEAASTSATAASGVPVGVGSAGAALDTDSALGSAAASRGPGRRCWAARCSSRARWPRRRCWSRPARRRRGGAARRGGGRARARRRRIGRAACGGRGEYGRAGRGEDGPAGEGRGTLVTRNPPGRSDSRRHARTVTVARRSRGSDATSGTWSRVPVDQPPTTDCARS